MMENFTTPFKARPTTYKGIKMRSRLEAHWAERFDECKRSGMILDWEYEPQCFGDITGQYLPDFRIERTKGGPVWVEIKPSSADPEPCRKKMEIIFSSEYHAALRLYLGPPPIPNLAWINDENTGYAWVAV